MFPNEPILAYLYVSSPAQVITGKMVLGNKRKIEDFWIYIIMIQKCVKEFIDI